MFFTEKLLQHMLSENGGDFISVRELVGREALEIISKQVKNRISDSDDFVESLLEFSKRVHVRFPDVDDLSDVSEREDIKSLSAENFDQEIREEWPNINRRLTHLTYEKMDEEFPILLEMFEVRGIVFAYEIEDKQTHLEEAMEFMVQREQYEKAAEIKDKLSEIGSDAVKSN